MRYRTRLTLMIVTLAVISNGVLLAISYRAARRMLVEEIESKVLSIAATAGAFIDGDLHQQIKEPEDQDSEAYRELESQFRQARDANRRDDTYIRYLYSMVESGESSAGSAFVVDAEEAETGNKSRIGEVYENEADDVAKLDIEAYQIEGYVQDEYGTWLSANAPIRDRSGQAVAALGVDLAVHDVLAKTYRLLWRGVAAMGVAVLLALGIAVFLSGRVTRPLHVLAATVKRIGEGDLTAEARLETKDEFGEVADALNKMTRGLRERDLLKGAMARYLSSQVAENIIQSGKMPELRGDRRKITVLFLDIRDFTQMADKMESEDVVQLLNEFFEKMIEIIFAGQGTLDKFTGDGLMALFGAPLDDPKQEAHAVEAAVRMQREIRRLCEKWEAQGRKLMQMGIGINTGMAVVGNIGSPQRMDYTAIGDTVNLASRLESATKELKVSILISQSTYDAVAGRFNTCELGKIDVRGKSEQISIYSVHDHAED